MKRYSETRIRKIRDKYPIADRLPEWFFRITEVSAGVYLGEGADTYGRTVSFTGTDPDQTLNRCIREAASDDLRPNHWQRTDAWITVFIMRATRRPPVSLAHILAWSEAINRLCANVDELNGAFNRLVAAGVITAQGDNYMPTDKGHRLFEQIEASCTGDLSERFTCVFKLLQSPEYVVHLEPTDVKCYVTDADFRIATDEMGQYLR